MTMPLSYLESLESGMGAQPAPHPADLRFVLCEGDPHGETFATLVSPSVSSCGVLGFRRAHSGPRIQNPTPAAAEQHLVRELGLTSLGVCNEHVSILGC